MRYGDTEDYNMAKIWSSNTLCGPINYEAERGKNYMTLISWCFTKKIPTKFLTQQEFESTYKDKVKGFELWQNKNPGIEFSFMASYMNKKCVRVELILNHVRFIMVVDFKINLLRLVLRMSWVFVMITMQ